MSGRAASFIAGLVLVGAYFGLAGADTGWPEVPDDALTPGAVATSDKGEICGRVGGLTYTKRNRVWEAKNGTLIKYGVPLSLRTSFQDDDRVPVCLGGDNADPRNHWPQPSNKMTADGLGYEAKDELDDLSCRQVCDGEATPQEAQSWFLGDWRVKYRQIFTH